MEYWYCIAALSWTSNRQYYYCAVLEKKPQNILISLRYPGKEASTSTHITALSWKRSLNIYTYHCTILEKSLNIYTYHCAILEKKAQHLHISLRYPWKEAQNLHNITAPSWKRRLNIYTYHCAILEKKPQNLHISLRYPGKEGSTSTHITALSWRGNINICITCTVHVWMNCLSLRLSLIDRDLYRCCIQCHSTKCSKHLMLVYIIVRHHCALFIFFSLWIKENVELKRNSKTNTFYISTFLTSDHLYGFFFFYKSWSVTCISN